MKFIRLNLLLLGLGVLVLAITSQMGCRAGAFAKPDFSKLAFWKKDHLKLGSNELPPPSAHFDPEPTGVAKSKAPVGDDLQKRVDRILAGAEKDKQLAGTDGPIREPYELDDIDPELNQGEDNSFDPATARGSNTGALADLQKSLENLKRSTDQASGDLANQMGQRVAQTEQAIDGWKSDFELPRQQMAQQAQQAADDFQRAARNQASQMIDQTQSGIQSSMNQANNQLQQAAAGLQNQAADTIGQFQSAMQNSFPTNNANVTAAPTETTAPRTMIAQPVAGPGTESASTGGGSGAFAAHTPLQPIAPPPSTTGNSYPDTGFASFDNPGTTTSPYQASPIRTAELPGPAGASANAAVSASSGNSTAGAEHRIPTSLLEGTSTFAPGSVKRLQPVGDQWQPPR